jgi:transcriptional regulator with XRE-family HTH domain
MVTPPDVSTARGNELRRFLRTCRARLTPADVGLPVDERRRASGLRRSDVAELADISIGWYGQFELGRAPHVSPQTVASIGRVLRLDATEIAYLFKLTTTEAPTCDAAVSERTAIDTARHVLCSVSNGPALLDDSYYNVVAANDAARRILDVVTGDNFVRKLFLDESWRSRYANWHHTAKNFVANMRTRCPGRIGDRTFVALVTEMHARSNDFARFWDAGDIATAFGQITRIRLATSEVVSLAWGIFPVPGIPDHSLVVAPPADGESFKRVSAFLESAS